MFVYYLAVYLYRINNVLQYKTLTAMTTTTTINKSRLFKRAWYLVKQRSYSLSYALTTVWAEMKAYIIKQANELAYTESLRNPQSSVSQAWNPSPEAMAAYYSSNAYKGD